MRATLPEGRHLHKAAASSQNRLQRIPHKAKMACMVARLGLVLLCFSVACSFNTNGVQILTAHDAGGTGGGGSQGAQCVPGASAECYCPAGQRSAQTCTAAGTFAPCVCVAPALDAGGVGGSDGATTSLPDASTTTGRSDARAATGGTGGGGTTGIVGGTTSEAGVTGTIGGSISTSGGTVGTGGATGTAGVGAGGKTEAGGGPGGTGGCPLIACPAIACLGGTQPNPDPCGCPICGPSPDAGVAKDASPPTACPMLASLISTDAAQLGWAAGRMLIACTYTNNVYGSCLSNDATACPEVGIVGGLTVDLIGCSSLCTADQYGLSYGGGIPNVSPPPSIDLPAGCKLTLAVPFSSVGGTYCCPCGM
ncbi:MAG: hypothetical protein WBP56_20000 [Polyangia bacterium]|jgi:hypothetical protein